MSTKTVGRVLYVGTNVGLFKASRGGGDDQYDLRPAGLQGQTVVAVQVDVHSSQRIYAGTRGEGVFISEDGGQTWNPSNTGISHLEVWSMAQHPKTGELYVGTQSPAVFKSTDQGRTWTNCRSFQDMEESLFWTFPRATHLAHIKSLYVVPEDPPAGVRRGRRGLDRPLVGWWRAVGNLEAGRCVRLPRRDHRAGLTGRGDRNLRRWRLPQRESGRPLREIRRGHRGRLHGRRLHVTASCPPGGPGTLFAAGAEVPPPLWFTREQGARAFFYRGDDGGRTWRKLPGDGAPPEGLRPAPRSAVIDPADADTVLFGLTDGSVCETRDGGESFHTVASGLPGWISGLCVAYPSAATVAPAPGSNGTASANAASNGGVEVGHEYEITITNEIDNPFIGPNGVTRIGDADVRIPHAKVGQKYRVRVLALGTNQFTQRTEATIQTVSGRN